jgi:hypothetical protein
VIAHQAQPEEPRKIDALQRAGTVPYNIAQADYLVNIAPRDFFKYRPKRFYVCVYV